MRSAVLGGLVTLSTTCAAAPLVRNALVRRGSFDIPNHRSSHHAPVPRGGGLACLVGVAFGALATGRRSGVRARTVLGIGFLAALGLADDQLGHVHHNVRLSGQIVAGAAIAPSVALLAPIAVVAPGVVNVVNFMDGINGITGTTAAVWGINALGVGLETQDSALATLGALTAGAGLGFLPWNVPEAQVFLGDVGSYLFGGLMTAGIAHAAQRPTVAWTVAAPLLPYGADAAQAILHRLRRGDPLTEAHRDHVYQRLVDQARLSHTTVAAGHAATALLVSWGARRRDLIGLLIGLAATAAYVTGPRWANRLPTQQVRPLGEGDYGP